MPSDYQTKNSRDALGRDSASNVRRRDTKQKIAETPSPPIKKENDPKTRNPRYQQK